MRLAVLILLATPALCGARCLPSGDDLTTDRPGFGESNVVIGSRVQIESGFTVERTDETHRTITAPEVLARIGVASRFELRVSTDGATQQATLTSSGWQGSTGRSDTTLGAKLQLFDSRRCGNVSIVPYLSTPTATHGFGSDHYDPGVEIAAGLKLPGAFALSSTFNGSDAGGDAGRAWQREVSAALEYDFLERFGVFAELDVSCGGRCGSSVDSGLTIAIRDNAQLDVEAGHRVHGDAPEWFVGGGYVWRMPLRMRRK